MRQIGWWHKEDIEQAKGMVAKGGHRAGNQRVRQMGSRQPESAAKGMVAKGGHRAGNQRVRQMGWWQKQDIEQATRECGKWGGGKRRT